MIKAILFDLGDVLLKSKFKGMLIEDVTKEVAKTLGVSYDTFKTIQKEYHQDLKIGRILFSDFSKTLKEKLNLQISTDKIIKVWDKCYLKISIPNKSLFSVVRKLKKHYEVGLISNIYDLTVKTDRKRGLFNIFEPCIFSCEVGLGKPQKEIYELALRELKVDATSCVFIDNKPEYLEIPKELGFYVIHFQNNTQFIGDLEKIGVKF